MTKLPISGGAWARDDKGGLKRAEAPTKSKPPRARAAKGKRAPDTKPEQKDADK